MKKYNHKFNDGDIVTDIEHREIFVFSDRRDGFRAEHAPGAFRLATYDEEKKLTDSGKDCVSF